MYWLIALAFFGGLLVGVVGLVVLILRDERTQQELYELNQKKSWEDGIERSRKLAEQRWPELQPAQHESLEHLWRMSDSLAFEKLVGLLFKAKGYDVQHVGKRTGDDGIDLIASNDDHRLIIQCKKYRLTNRIGHPEVRNLIGAMEPFKPCTGMLVTTSELMPKAAELALSVGLDVIDGGLLVQELADYGIGLT